MILESYAKIDSNQLNLRLEIPQANYVVQCNAVPNNNTIANMYMYVRMMIRFKNNQKLITC